MSGNEQETGASGGVVSAQYGLSFTYSSNQGASSSNSYSGPFTWSSENFTYVNGTDNQVGYSAPIFVWFAMDPAVPAGNPFFSLNTQMTVLSKNYSFQLPTENQYVQTIHVRGTGLYQRNDSYGVFSASYTWDEYFDPATGFIVGYNYVEQDNGQYQGQVGELHLHRRPLRDHRELPAGDRQHAATHDLGHWPAARPLLHRPWVYRAGCGRGGPRAGLRGCTVQAQEGEASRALPHSILDPSSPSIRSASLGPPTTIMAIGSKPRLEPT